MSNADRKTAGGKGVNTPTAEADARYRANLEAAVGPAKKVKGGSFVYCSKLKKMVPKYAPESRVDGPMVQRGLTAFKSPIDGQVINTRAQLAAHNTRHGVTNASDYSAGYVEKQAHKRVAAGKQHLKETRHRDVARAVDAMRR